MAEAKKKTETIRLFSDGGKYKGDLFVSVNGVHYQLQRGKNIEVPPEVAEVIRHAVRHGRSCLQLPRRGSPA